MKKKIQRFVVNFLEEYCLHHPWWYLGRMNCGMAMLSYRLDEKWNLGEWKKPSEKETV